MKYMGDPSFLGKIQKARSDNEEGNFDSELMPRNLTDIFVTESSKICGAYSVTQAIQIQKKLQKMSIDHMKELKKLPLAELNPELQIIAQVLADKVFNEMKIESEDIDATTERLNLDANPDY